MIKYIVKNCPALRKMVTINSSKGHETFFDVCSSKHCLCKDRTDCPLKQVVKIYAQECPIKEIMNADDNEMFEAGRLAKRVLQTLQVEEVE